VLTKADRPIGVVARMDLHFDTALRLVLLAARICSLCIHHGLDGRHLENRKIMIFASVWLTPMKLW